MPPKRSEPLLTAAEQRAVEAELEQARTDQLKPPPKQARRR
jgi:hypothetical protein